MVLCTYERAKEDQYWHYTEKLHFLWPLFADSKLPESKINKLLFNFAHQYVKRDFKSLNYTISVE